MENTLTKVYEMNPNKDDVVAQTKVIKVWKLVELGWNVLCEGMIFSQLSRIATRYKIESEGDVL